jgi:hypothetical protein
MVLYSLMLILQQVGQPATTTRWTGIVNEVAEVVAMYFFSKGGEQC